MYIPLLHFGKYICQKKPRPGPDPAKTVVQAAQPQQNLSVCRSLLRRAPCGALELYFFQKNDFTMSLIRVFNSLS